MSFSEAEVVATVSRLSVTRLRAWVSRGWVRPETPEPPSFSEADVARICLLCDLCDELQIDDDTLPVVLSLIDQIHGLRRQLRILGRAIEAQPITVQEEIKRAFRALSEE